MIPESQIKKARKLLEAANNPIYFFDDDADGTTSFLQLYKKYGGRGLIMKEGKELQVKYWDSVRDADLIVILDMPMLQKEFMEKAAENKIPIIYVDHHPPVQVSKNVLYLNPRIDDYEDARSTSYWAAIITKEINWLSLTGAITDYTYPEDFIKAFSKERPDLLPKNVKDINQAMNETKIGLLGMIINANVRGTVKDAMASVKTLTRIKNPDEILKQGTPAGKYLWKKYAKYKKFYDSIKNQVNVTKEKIVYLKYYEDNNSVSSALSTEISSKNPEKVVIIARIVKDDVYISIRAQEMNILEVAKEAMNEFSGKCGGHDHAIGASLKEEELEAFVKKLTELVK